MADNWQAIPGYASNNYTDTMVFEVDGATKQLQKISGQTLIAGEKNSQYIRFQMPRYWDGIDVSGKGISIVYGLAGKYYGETAGVSAERTDDKLRFGWVVPEQACCIAGPLLFVLVIKDSSYVLKTQIAETPVQKSINLDEVVPEPTKELWYRDFQVRIESTLSAAENAVDEAQTVLEQARKYVGAPLVARTAEEMEDTSRIYVYTGSETGYTSGHWYYHDGEQWTDGGVYNSVAVDTDTTLSISGKAADAKETGDQITELKSGFNDLYNTAYVTDSASGGVAHFVDGADNVPLKSLKVAFEPVQSGSGDPSPDNVRPISGWTGIRVTRAGKNIFPSKGLTKTLNGITIHSNDDGSFTVNGTATANAQFDLTLNNELKLQSGQYTVGMFADKAVTFDIRHVWWFFYNMGAQADIVNCQSPSKTFTLNAVAATRFYLRIISGATVDNVTLYPMLVYGSDAPTEFAPYNGETYNVSLSNAGTVYGGTLDVVSGELNVTHGYIASYSGQELPSAWISDRDVYVEGARPTTGAQVVYQLATPLTYQLSATEIKSLLGINNVWSDAGDVDVEYRANTKLYINKRLAEVTA